jgi:hypothetical protein
VVLERQHTTAALPTRFTRTTATQGELLHTEGGLGASPARQELREALCRIGRSTICILLVGTIGPICGLRSPAERSAARSLPRAMASRPYPRAGTPSSTSFSWIARCRRWTVRGDTPIGKRSAQTHASWPSPPLDGSAN